MSCVIAAILCNVTEKWWERKKLSEGVRLLGWEVLPFDSLSVKHLISPDKITPKSHIKVSRIKEMIT